MTKYIKNKDGKFAGSIGSGKTSVPTTAPTAPVAAAPAETSAVDVQAVYSQYQSTAHAPTHVPMDNVWEIHEDSDVSFWHCGRPGYWDYNDETGDDEVYCSKCQSMLDADSDVTDADALETSPPFTVGQTYTTHRSGITGTIEEIVPNRTGSFRLRLDVNGEERWTTALVSR